jgi:1,4-dihydroxy-2-naphthoyl-CoA hydrolase
VALPKASAGAGTASRTKGSPVGVPGAAVEALGLEVDELTATRVVGHIQLGPEHHTPWGIVHGGVYATAVESAASLGASAAVAEQGMVAVGLTNTTHFLRPLSSGRVTVTAVALHQGRTQQLWQVDITDGQGRRIAARDLRLQNIDLQAMRSPSTMGGSK